jgi:hypothetical protein
MSGRKKQSIATKLPKTKRIQNDTGDAEVVKQKAFNEIIEHYNSQYIKQLNLDKFPAVASIISKSVHIQSLSTKNRIISNAQILKHTFLHSKTNNICTCFKVTAAGTSAVYAYLYTQYDPTKEPSVKHKYFCCGGAYKSQDGEYRNSMLAWSRFLELYDRYSPIISQVEKMVVEKLSSSILALHAEFFYPTNFTDSERKFEDSINALRLPIKFYIFCWLKDFINIHTGSVENHLNPSYISIIYRIEDLPVYEALVNEFQIGKLQEISERIKFSYKNLDKNYTLVELGCGQKIFPMTAFEAIKIDDINFSIWRELYISNMCSDLVLNFITPSFPFINNWFFIENAHSGLFDNASMHEKYKHSEIATQISTQLRDIDKYNYTDRMRDHGPINSRFMRLSKRIQKSIVYADSAIKLTDLAVCVTSEYVGRTFRDIPAVSVNTPSYGINRLFIDFDIWSKHMFEYIYSFYCMNSKFKMLHGDLHMNNITLFKLYNMQSSLQIIKNPSIIYILRDTIYKLPHYGVYSCIIDFSRSILGDYAKISEEFGERYADMYFREQKMRMMRLLFTYFAKFMERNHIEVNKVLDNNFPLAFKILTAIDPFVMFNNIVAMLSVDQYIRNGQIKLHPDLIKFTNKLVSFSESFILENFKRAISGDIKSVDDIEWPNFMLLKKYFERYEFVDIAKVKPDAYFIMDVFNENSEIKYKIENYDTWSPLLSLDTEFKIYQKYNMVFEDKDKWLAFRNRDETSDIERLLDKYEQQEQDVINIEPWMLY